MPIREKRAAARVSAFLETSADGPAVRGTLHEPADVARDGLVLTHGAGSSAEAPLLVAVARVLTASGLTVLRCDLPYRQASPTGPPPRGSATRDREGLRRAVEAMRRLVPGRVFLGGHSYGGRQASIAAADDPALVDGLLLLSYPLHPPDRPDRLRTDHFPRLHTPVLFAHGTRDPFGSLDELRAAIRLIPGATTLLPVEGTPHALVQGRRRTAADVASAVGSAFLALVT